MSPAGPVTGTNFALGSYEKGRDEFWREFRGTKQLWRNTKV